MILRCIGWSKNWLQFAASDVGRYFGQAVVGPNGIGTRESDDEIRTSDRTEPYASVRRNCYPEEMTTIRAEDVRIPRHAREAVARHERVVVVNHERPAFIIMHPDDTAAASRATRRGRPLREALGLLAGAAPPDPGFADDMEAVLAQIGPVPNDPWARS